MRVSLSFGSRLDLEEALDKMQAELRDGIDPSISIELEDADGLPVSEGEAMTVEFVSEGGAEPNPEFATPVASLHREG